MSEPANNETARLAVHHREIFAKLRVPEPLVGRAQIRSVSHCEAAQLVGDFHKFDLTGLAFPYYRPGETRPHSHRVRRDNVRGDEPKYVAPPGHRALYFPPASDALLHDAAVPVIFLESEKGELALTALAVRAQRRWLVVALGGCWGFRAKTGIETAADGSRFPTTGPHPDLGLIALQDREAIIVFDSNATSNSLVGKAQREFARLLQERGAKVRIARIPPSPGINGPDDFLAAFGDEAMVRIIDSATAPGAAHGVPKKSQATKLIEIAESVSELFHTPDRRGYAAIGRDDHREIWAVKSSEFQEFLVKLLYDREGAAPSSEAVRQATNLLHAKAVFDGEEHPVYTRVAFVGGTVYLDLGDRDWQCVEITPKGWHVVPHPGGIRFRRAASMYPLPAPRRGVKIGRLWDFVNVRGADRLLFAAWLLHALRASGPYPILVVNGEQGSAKTTAAWVVKSLLDPSKAPTRGTPRDERDLMIAAANSHLVAYDNISHLSADMTDSLCRLATGGGLSTRQLYMDEQEIVFEAMRPIVLTGIEALAVRGDFADRAVVLNLPMLERKKSESEFKAEFDAARPELLGGLLDVMCEVLRGVGAARLKETPRMVDFARLGVTAERILDFRTGEFMGAYKGNRKDASETILEASLVAIRLRDLMSQRPEWEGTASELLDALNGLATDAERRRRSWPSTPNALGGALARLAPSFRQVGIQIDRDREGHGRRRVMTICKIGKTSSASSADPYRAHPEIVDSPGVSDSDPVADKADKADNETRTLEAVEVREKEWEV